MADTDGQETILFFRGRPTRATAPAHIVETAIDYLRDGLGEDAVEADLMASGFDRADAHRIIIHAREALGQSGWR